MLDNNYLNKKIYLIIKKKIEEVLSYEPEEIEDNFEKFNDLNSSLLNEINKDNIIFIEELILEICENKFLLFFNRIKELNPKTKEKLFPKFFHDSNNNNLIVFDLSFQLYEQIIKFLDEISFGIEDEKINFGKLYSIAYLKLYLYKVVGFTKNDLNKVDEFKEIFQKVNYIKNKNFKKVILIYILKLYYHYLNNDFELLKFLCDIKLYNLFADDLSVLFRNNDIIITNYHLFPIEKDKYEIYLKYSRDFEFIKKYKFNNEEETKQFIINLLNIKDLDIFITISINKIFFNLYLNYCPNTIEEYKNFFDIFNSLIIEYFHENKELIKLLNLLFNTETFESKIISKIKDKKTFEILLYGFRYCIQSINFERDDVSPSDGCQNQKTKNYFYKSLLTKHFQESINKTYIPGMDNRESLHLVTLETIITHLNTKPDRHGCYVCSCGYYYDIDPCGFPTKNRTFDCPVCGLKIGWGPKPVKAGEETHGMVIRPGHLRIFKDEKAKKYQMRVFDEVDENIPNMILSDYIKNIIEPIRNKNYTGIEICSKNYFIKNNKQIRNLTQINYRLLNFIFYSHLFFGYCIGNIDEFDIKNYLIQNMNIIEIIESNWELLNEALKEKNINNIQIFMNIIFSDVSKLIKKCVYLQQAEEREYFENEVEKIITEYIEKYDDFSDKYIEKNKLQIKYEDYYNIETIISELIPITEDIYNKKEYPMFKHFIFTNYKSKQDCLNHIPDKNKYTLTYQILINKQEYSLLKYLSSFNNFINYINKEYSLMITREESHRRKLKEEKIFKNNDFIRLFNDFIEVWNIIKIYVKKYKCNSEMPIKELNSNDYLSYFLNDNSEFGYGMYIAAASQCFIEWQNSFLNNIIENNISKECILYNYIEDLNNKIGVNEAKENQILLIEERFKNSKYKDLDNMIYLHSERDIFKIGKINYNEYNSFKYDYDKIEEELGKIILPGLKLFKSEEDLQLIIYWGEGFKGRRSQILIVFNNKYPQKVLELIEKNKIINYIKEKSRNENSLFNDSLIEDNIFKQLFSFIQMLIIDLATKINVNIDTSISSLIKLFYSDYVFPSNLIDFYTSIGETLKIDKLIDIFAIFEHLCFNDLLSLLKDEYKKEINEIIKKDIIKTFDEELNHNNIISKKDLSKALRRLISRYLVGTGDINDIKPENELSLELCREDLWDGNLKKFNDLDEKIKEFIGDLKLQVNQSFYFYELIGFEDKKEFENYFS